MIHRLLHLLGVTFPGSLVVGTYPGDRRIASGLRCHKCGRVTHAIWIDGGRYVDEPWSLRWSAEVSFALYHFLAEPHPVDPPAKDTMTDKLYRERAAEIFAEDRDDYQIGPAPRTYCVEFKHDTGRTFRLAFSDFMPAGDVANILDSIGKACKEGGVDKLRMALSLAQAVTDYDDAAHALSPEGDA